MKAALVAALGAGVAIPAFGLFLRYRRDLNAARARLAAVERHVISTPWAAVEYAERGDGDPVLVVHGIFHNCVGGLLSVRDYSDRRFIAPSRFGYLGSSMPPNATPAAQADAFAALLDALGIDRIDRHRRISRCDIGVATGPASSGEGEASRCARRQPAGKPHRRRPTVIGEAIQPATPPVGTTTRSPRMRRASARPSAFPARGLSASNREGT